MFENVDAVCNDKEQYGMAKIFETGTEDKTFKNLIESYLKVH